MNIYIDNINYNYRSLLTDSNIEIAERILTSITVYYTVINLEHNICLNGSLVVYDFENEESLKELIKSKVRETVSK